MVIGVAENVVWVDVDDLGIDMANIRGGRWDHDKEFMQDIKKNGILNPLAVRPAHPKAKVKYAIVCGSRRYNAAIEAGLKKVPCFVEEMDDITALGRTIAENKHRTDIPAWQYAMKIGQMYERLDGKGKKMDIVNIIMSKTGFKETTVYQYLDVYELPTEVFELMKEPAERSKKVKELLKASLGISLEETLSVEKAWLIARGLRDYPKEKMWKVATFVLDKSLEATKGLIELTKRYPKKSMDGIYDIYTGIPREITWSFQFPANIARAIDEACMRKQVDRVILVTGYVKKGLKDDGFL